MTLIDLMNECSLLKVGKSLPGKILLNLKEDGSSDSPQRGVRDTAFRLGVLATTLFPGSAGFC
jgi:hypothetical protein